MRPLHGPDDMECGWFGEARHSQSVGGMHRGGDVDSGHRSTRVQRRRHQRKPRGRASRVCRCRYSIRRRRSCSICGVTEVDPAGLGGARHPMTIPGDPAIDRSRKPADRWSHDQMTGKCPDPPGCDERFSDAEMASPRRALGIDPVRRRGHVALGEAVLLEIQNLPRGDANVVGQAAFDPAGAGGAEAAIAVEDQKHAAIVACGFAGATMSACMTS